MLNKFFKILILSFLLVSCATHEKNTSSQEATTCESTDEQKRSVAAIICEDLFKPKVQLHIVENNEPTGKKAVHEATVELMTEVMPKSINDTFWKVLEQLARNEDSKLRIDSNRMVLTKQVNENLKIHSTYVYDPPSNTFVLKRIDYTEKNRRTMELSAEPLYKNSQKIRDDLTLKISELAAGSRNRTVGIPAFISHDVHQRIEGELKDLNLFTTHELLKISQLSPKTRMARYQFLLNSRKVKNFIFNDFMEELIKKPVKTVVISVMSIAVLSHTDFLKNVVSIKHETPEWVAPSMVKMAGRYPENAQVEIVSLMKTINNNKDDVKVFEKDFEAKKNFVNIDDVDRFTIQADPVNKKTYFVMDHENQNGTTDVYSVEIDPAKYPVLSKSAEVASADSHSGEIKK